MSYILEALRKSEHERRQGQTLSGYDAVPIIPVRNSGARWPYWLIAILLLNTAVLGYVLWSNKSSGDVVAEAAISRSAPAEVVPVDITQAAQAGSPSVETVPSPAPVEERVPERPEPTTVSIAEAPSPVAEVESELPPEPRPVPQPRPEKPEVAVQEEKIPLLRETPESFQRRVPDLVFNSHIYSSAPRSRRVMINQRNLSEGDRLGNLRVEKITATGVVLRLDDTSFEVPVVRDWIQPR